MRDTFVKTLLEIAKKDKNVYIVTGDLGFGVLKPFWEELPDQIINAGIAEQNMTSIAAGLALQGKIVYTYSIGNFPTLRCIEQIRNDCAYHDANVKVVCVGGGFVYGSLGMSHHATEDIAIMRTIPGMTIINPADDVEARKAVEAAYYHDGPVYMRFGRLAVPVVFDEDYTFEIGKGVELKEGSDVTIIATGLMVSSALDAADMLLKDGIDAEVINIHTIKPIDKDIIIKASKETGAIVTCEEHSVIGGLGSAVSEVLCENAPCVIRRVGVKDVFGCSGKPVQLFEKFGLDEKTIIKNVKDAINNK